MISGVGDKPLWELVQGDGDAGLETDIQECVFRHVVVVRGFLLVFVVGAGGVGEAWAVEAVVVVGDGNAAARDVADFGGLGFDVLAFVSAEGAHASQGRGARVRLAPHSEELLEAFLTAWFRVPEARAEFIAIRLVVAHERHDAVLDLHHRRAPRALGECLLVGRGLGGRQGGAAVGGECVARSRADGSTV